MSIHASPGVYFEIIDFSLYAPKLSQTILALVGKTKKGPTEPTFISSVRQYIETFGTPGRGEYSALAAISFLEFGNSLWFSRLVGPGATKAIAEIPKAIEIYDELLETADDTNKYIFSTTLSDLPVPNSVEIKIVDPNDENNFITLVDNGYGKFSSIHNENISDYPNFINYGTGDFRFTLTENVTIDSEISIRYNYKEFDITSEETLLVEAVNDVDYKYSGMLNHGNIVDADTKFSLSVETDTDVYTFVTTGTPTENVYTLEGTDSSEASIGSGTLNILTGIWEVTLSSTDNVATDDVFVVDYSYSTSKNKTLGTVGESNPNGGTYGLSYIGSLNSVVNPNSISVLVDGEVETSDNGEGKFVTGVVTSDNSVNYDDKTVEFTLINPPADGFLVTASYAAKYNTILETVAAAETGSGNVSTILTEAPIIKQSVNVKVGPTFSATDNGEGEIIGTGINGTINYETGEINVNYMHELSAGDTVEVFYLSRLGVAKCKYEGEAYNGIQVEFYKDNFSGYGLKVWNSYQGSNQNPEENFKNITFDDPNISSYFINKINSRLIDIELDDETGSYEPLINTAIILNDGNSDATNITINSAITALSEYSNAEEYDINLIACPDYPGNKSIINKLIQLSEIERGDCFAIIDTPQNLTVQQATEWHNGSGQWSNENAINSSFCAIYYPWLQITDEFTESFQWVPPSVRMVSVYAYNDRVAEVWNAPAGLNRGRLFRTIKVETQLNANDRDLLYATGSNCVNPICNFVGDGIVVFGQKTAQRKPSALDRVNVMRLIIYMTKVLATATKYLLFEPHDILTWTLYSQIVNPFVEDIRARRGLYEFKVVCDETTNTPYNIDNNTMVAEIWLKPTKVAERLINRFVITSTGASFSDLDNV